MSILDHFLTDKQKAEVKQLAIDIATHANADIDDIMSVLIPAFDIDKSKMLGVVKSNIDYAEIADKAHRNYLLKVRL